MGTSSIEWTESTWNPLTGCTKVSPGCRHCYAERLAMRLKAMGQANYQHGFELSMHEEVLARPLAWRKPQTIFVNSMSDLYHEDVPTEFIDRVFEVMNRAHWHTFQVLTKRSARLAALGANLPWAPNIWQGVSVENSTYLNRIDHLRQAGSAVRFLSLEPLLGPLPDLDLTDVHWVIIGGESGPGCRPMDLGWVREVRDQCLAARMPFFLKQLGGFPDKRGKDRAVLDGRLWRDMPRPAPSGLADAAS